MADSTEDVKPSENQPIPTEEESSEVTVPSLEEPAIDQMLAYDENLVTLDNGGTTEEPATALKDTGAESGTIENPTVATEESKMECDNEAEFLELSGEHVFDTDILDDTCIDEEESKEHREADGDHEDMKEDDHEDMKEDDHEDMKEDDDDDEEEEDPDDTYGQINLDPNVMPQVNVAVLANRKWQVKVYPLKPADFVSGHISRVFKHARESLLYLLSPGKNARGKAEMYLSSVNQTVRCVHSLMRMEYFHPEINVEIIKKNDEGAVEEKAYLRFDSKLSRILTMRPFRRSAGGRKRDRLIGSVFVKNLPPGTTKDTLRVMFPFAQEINYNPEKFKDCTARLVLHYRSHVIPCLKAFAKAELGGNVLELHPLTKRKRGMSDNDDESEDQPEAKQKRKTEETNKDETTFKNDETTADARQSSSEKKEPFRKESRDRSETKSKEDKGKADDKAKKTPQQNRRPNNNNKPGNNRTNNQRMDHRSDNQSYRPKLVGGKERSGPQSSRNQAGRSPARGPNVRQDRTQTSSQYNRDDRNRNTRDFNSSARRLGNQRNARSRGSGSAFGGSRGSGSGFGGSRGSGSGGFGGSRGSGSGRQNQSSLGQSNYSLGTGLGIGGATALAASDANLAINAEATKEMVLLQNQLSMAIKNQLAMLNQTQLAVEQAKRGASSIVLGSDIHSTLSSRTSPKGMASSEAGSSTRRSVDQYRPAADLNDSMDRYGGRAQQRPKQQRLGGGDGDAGRNKRGGGRGGRGRGRGGGSGAYSKRGGGGGGAYGKRGGGSGAGSSYRGGAGSSYRDEEDWDSPQQADSYSQDYSYDSRDGGGGGFGSSSGRSSYTNQDGGYSGYY